MTQRVDLATVMDRLAIDELITGYALAVDDADWPAYRRLFTADGRLDCRDAGGIAGPVDEAAAWLTGTLRAFPVRQHLIVNRRVRLHEPDGYPADSAEARADYVDAIPLDGFLSGGRYRFVLRRTPEGWRVHSVEAHERWRRAPGASEAATAPGRPEASGAPSAPGRGGAHEDASRVD
ncbi:nuclear transport factor 2 family protein [Streptomyces sp. MUM 203J]|uniref:nuclear transport factor 2 family protein n=1 Tax=Streptomyces sp. MUM 203J TaxID=2791990 RepID=UPI001F038673|nr:nuclear transport factor 2 family protein [Streptomyces sp. MUM 203J]MCH0540986.1 nuclear transport factor 2 family protein [Streptomyces sp. MUM 203J]